MHNVLLTEIVLLVLVATAYSLECYTCTDFGKEPEEDIMCPKSTLEANAAKYVMTCPSFEDTCQRSHSIIMDAHHIVTMSCNTHDRCQALKNVCEESGDDCNVECCTTDKCNAGSSVSFNVFVMTVSSLLGLALVK